MSMSLHQFLILCQVLSFVTMKEKWLGGWVAANDESEEMWDETAMVWLFIPDDG